MWYCPNCHARLTIQTPDISAVSKKRRSKAKWIVLGVENSRQGLTTVNKADSVFNVGRPKKVRPRP